MARTRRAKTSRAVTRRQKWVKTFLATLARTATVSQAAREAGVHKDTAYALRKRDAKFAKGWDDALEESNDVLRAEAWRRSVHGAENVVTHQGQLVLVWVDADGRVVPPGDPAAVRQAPLVERRYSDQLLMFLMKAHDPERYGDRSQVDLTSGGKPVQFTLAIGERPIGGDDADGNR